MSPLGDSQLPRGWEVRRLGDIAECRLGKMLDKDKNVGELRPYLRNINVRWGSFDLKDVKEMRIEEGEVERYEALAGDLLVCEGGEPGRCAVWRGDQTMFIQKALHRVRPKRAEVSADYLRHYLEFAARSGCLEPLFTGTTIKHLPGVKLAELDVVIAPRGEQDEIVAQIDRLSLMLAAAEADLGMAKARAETFGSHALNRLLHLSPSDTLPRGWSWTTLGEMASLSSGGTPSRSNASFFGEGYPWIKIGDLNEGVVVSAEESITQEGLENSAARLLAPGAVMVAMYGASIGRTGILGLPAATNQAICSMDPNEEVVLREYLFFLLRASKRKFVAAGYGGAQPNISQRFLRSYEVPLPPLVEQQELLEKGRSIQRAEKDLAAAIVHAGKRAYALRTSLLSAAFAGNLRDRTDARPALPQSSILVEHA